jgi:large subunit ribosomal protein L9
MRVLLVADVMRAGMQLGWLGDIVEVNSGFARNYLLPRGLAVIPTEAAIKSLAEEKTKRAEVRKQQRQKLEETAAAVNGAEVVIAAKANETGGLFGSVGSREIAANLLEQGFEVADDVVQLSEHIKQVGTTTVKLKFSQDLAASVNVVVVSKDKAADSGQKGKGKNQEIGPESK